MKAKKEDMETEKDFKAASAYAEEREEISLRPLFAGLFIFLATILVQLYLGGGSVQRDERGGSVKLHVLPASELDLGAGINREDAPALKLKPTLSQFSGLFSVSTGNNKAAGVAFIEADISEEPTDVVVTSVVISAAGHVTAASPVVSSLVVSPPPAASPSPPPSPSTPPPPPWWVQDALRAPLAKTDAGAKALAAGKTTGDWAIEVTDPRPGTLLVARTSEPPPGQPYFADAAILLVKVCHCRPSIFGIVLSGPPSATNLTVGDTMAPAARPRLHSFVNHTLRIGGPAGPHVTALHDAASVAGAQEVQPGVYAGGCPVDAQRRVDAGEISADAFSFFAGYAAWPIERLRDEVRAGRWGVVKASRERLMRAIRQGASATDLESELI